MKRNNNEVNVEEDESRYQKKFKMENGDKFCLDVLLIILQFTDHQDHCAFRRVAKIFNETFNQTLFSLPFSLVNYINSINFDHRKFLFSDLEKIIQKHILQDMTLKKSSRLQKTLQSIENGKKNGIYCLEAMTQQQVEKFEKLWRHCQLMDTMDQEFDNYVDVCVTFPSINQIVHLIYNNQGIDQEKLCIQVWLNSELLLEFSENAIERKVNFENFVKLLEGSWSESEVLHFFWIIFAAIIPEKDVLYFRKIAQDYQDGLRECESSVAKEPEVSQVSKEHLDE